MKYIPLLAFLLFATLIQANPADPASAQDQQLLAALKDVQAQQIAITENQVKIEEKLATVAEAVRVARIYSSRSGN